MGPDIAPKGTVGQDVNKASDGSTNKPLTSGWPSAVRSATDLNTDPSCDRTMDPDVGLGDSPDLGITMASGGCAGSSSLPIFHCC